MYPKVSLAREEMGLMIEILFGESEAASMKVAKNKILVTPAPTAASVMARSGDSRHTHKTDITRLYDI